MPRNSQAMMSEPAYNTQQVVGDFFENRVSQIFGLARTDRELQGNVPDLFSGKNNFYMEVKASSYTNGGVIKIGQLTRFQRRLNERMFFAFPYHSITRNMAKSYPTEELLREALDLRSLHVMPFSLIMAHFKKSNPRPYKRESFVQMKESMALGIFSGEPEMWQMLGLEKREYKMTKPHSRVFLITQRGKLEEELIASLHPEFI